jgi:hypothetical protein
MLASELMIKEGIRIIAAKPKFAADYKSVDQPAKFQKVCGDLKAWLGDDFECSDQEVARGIYTHFKSTFSFGKPAKIGSWSHVQIASMQPRPVILPTYTNLEDSWNVGAEYSKVRKEVAAVLGINDKGHTQHGSNFSGTQSLRQIILNLVDKVAGKVAVADMRSLIKARYNLDLS